MLLCFYRRYNTSIVVVRDVWCTSITLLSFMKYLELWYNCWSLSIIGCIIHWWFYTQRVNPVHWVIRETLQRPLGTECMIVQKNIHKTQSVDSVLVEYVSEKIRLPCSILRVWRLPNRTWESHSTSLPYMWTSFSSLCHERSSEDYN